MPDTHAKGDVNDVIARWNSGGPVGAEAIDALVAEVERLRGENEQLQRYADGLEDREAARRTELERLREALRPFAALCDAIDDFGGMSDAEWLRLKSRVGSYAMRAREALLDA
jgi:hypothetical protein